MVVSLSGKEVKIKYSLLVEEVISGCESVRKRSEDVV